MLSDWELQQHARWKVAPESAIAPHHVPAIRDSIAGGSKKARPTLKGAGALSQWPLYEWIAEHLPEARLWWISEDLSNLISSAAPELPDDTLLHGELVSGGDFQPHMTDDAVGFAVFEKSVICLAECAPHCPKRFDAIMWSSREVTGITGTGGLLILPFIRNAENGSWALSSAHSWPAETEVLSEDLDPHQAGLLESDGAETSERRRLLYSLWALIEQEEISDRSEWTESRDIRRQKKLRVTVQTP